jgi:hypothetical protein
MLPCTFLSYAVLKGPPLIASGVSHACRLITRRRPVHFRRRVWTWDPECWRILVINSIIPAGRPSNRLCVWVLREHGVRLSNSVWIYVWILHQHGIGLGDWVWVYVWILNQHGIRLGRRIWVCVWVHFLRHPGQGHLSTIDVIWSIFLLHITLARLCHIQQRTITATRLQLWATWGHIPLRKLCVIWDWGRISILQSFRRGLALAGLCDIQLRRGVPILLWQQLAIAGICDIQLGRVVSILLWNVRRGLALAGLCDIQLRRGVPVLLWQLRQQLAFAGLCDVQWTGRLTFVLGISSGIFIGSTAKDHQHGGL